MKRTASAHLTSVTFLALGALHAAWGHGSAFPFDDRADLADAVIGGDEVPPPLACYAVAVALAAAALLVEDKAPLAPPLPRIGLTGAAGVLALRGAVGLAGRTDLLSPGSVSSRFRRLDRRFYSPLCLLLAAGALHARS